MVESLSATERTLIDDVCRHYRRWDPQATGAPRLEKILGGGMSNRTVLLRGSRRFVLRIATDAPIGVCRERELRIQQSAAVAGLAPRVCIADTERGLLLSTYLDGSAGDSPPGDTPAPRNNPSAIAGLLRRIHRLPVAEQAQPLTRLLERWSAHRGPDSAVSGLLDQHGDAAEALTGGAGDLDGLATVTCHNDLLAANRRCHQGRLMAVDWEYAAPGPAFFDLAVCASELSPADRDTLLQQYLGRAPDSEDLRHFRAATAVYGLIAASWFESRLPDSPALEESLRFLGSALRNLRP